MLQLSHRYLSPSLGIHQLILLCAFLFTLFFNLAFFRNAELVYGGSLQGWGFLGSLAVFLFAVTVLLLSLLCVRHATKPVLTILLLVGAGASYFMNRFNIIVDTTMLTNVAGTDSKEVKDLLSLALVLQIMLLGILPVCLLWRTKITCTKWLREVRNRMLLMAGAILLALISIVPFTAEYASFFREHKLLRYYANPVTAVYSSLRFISDAAASVENAVRLPLGLGAHIPAGDLDRELIILVLGEAARADHLGLNGYARNTTPLLAKEDVITLPDVSSCGTATAYSVPCMFSLSDRSDFSIKEAGNSENLLDILQHAGVGVLWRDNNSDSKGVTAAIEFQDFQTAANNQSCDGECRDIGMLDGLDEWISAHPTGDLTIVLHQMGNHGPAYYKRYPAEYGRFTPTCRSSELADCTSAQIVNSYDNAILYTDYFLSQVIAFLQQHDSKFETAMLYMSDHGESLGENGLYLHGLPYMLAPEAQKHVAGLLWFGDNYHVDQEMVKQRTQAPLSHDDYFHTVLGLMEIETPEYDPAKDWLAGAHLAE